MPYQQNVPGFLLQLGARRFDVGVRSEAGDLLRALSRPEPGRQDFSCLPGAELATVLNALQVEPE